MLGNFRENSSVYYDCALGNRRFVLHLRFGIGIWCFYGGSGAFISKNILVSLWIAWASFWLFLFLIVKVLIIAEHSIVFSQFCFNFFLIVFNFGHKTHIYKAVHLLFLILRPNVFRFFLRFIGLGFGRFGWRFSNFFITFALVNLCFLEYNFFLLADNRLSLTFLLLL